MIGIVDIAIGNPKSIKNALNFMNIESELISDPVSIKTFKKLILPGVGNYGAYIEKLNSTGFYSALSSYSKVEALPILGICVGAQALLERSAESECVAGLGLIPGEVSRIHASPNQKIPNVGWCQIEYSQPLFISDSIDPKEKYYFSHSYEMKVESKFLVAQIAHDDVITAIIKKDNIIGVQFHPEKSNKAGLKFLKDFSRWNT